MLRYGIARALLRVPSIRRSSTSVWSCPGDTQRVDTFLDPHVQKLLRDLTGRDYAKIFKNRKIGKRLHEPTIKFMTEEDLQEAVNQTEERADHLLSMPPVVSPVKDEEMVLSFDPRIQGHDESAFVFTDISLSSSNRERLIVIRDLDGTLRHAERSVRQRMNSIYFPSEGREVVVPKMFSDPAILKTVLDRASPTDNTYEFILDRATVQFDPDDPEYTAIVQATYDHIDEMKDYDYLKSTRHFGPLVFYLTSRRKMDNILIYSIQNERIDSDAVPLVSLFTLIFPECKCKERFEATENGLEKVRCYIELDAVRRAELELCLNSYEEVVKCRVEGEKGLQRAHGF